MDVPVEENPECMNGSVTNQLVYHPPFPRKGTVSYEIVEDVSWILVCSSICSLCLGCGCDVTSPCDFLTVRDTVEIWNCEINKPFIP